MPSKGIYAYTYIAVGGVEVEFSVPGQTITKRDPDKFTIDHLEVDSKNLGRFKFTGKFGFTVRRDGRELTNQWIDVNSMTGGLSNGTMNVMEQTPSVFAEDVIIVYGFYDAGPGHAGLPNQHQCFVTVTHNNENWMRDLAPPGSDKENRPFNRMVLPSSHDIGMNSLQTVSAILQKASGPIIKEVIGRNLPNFFDVFNKVGDGAIGSIAPDIIRALAITQKDNIDTILKIGGRYFEFRPAKCHRKLQSISPLDDAVYFQHGPIPGMLYAEFLHDIVQFLQDHPDEIVVVQLRWDGVPAESPRPSDDELRSLLDDALRDKDIQAGNADDMLQRSIADLRRDRKRLIVTQDLGQCSNYDDDASATLNGDPIHAKLEDMANNPPGGHPIYLLQCQATATNIRDVVIASVIDSDTSTSPLLATKAICDVKILQLLRDRGRDIGREDGVVVILNDFLDGATVDVAIGLCRDRLG